MITNIVAAIVVTIATNTTEQIEYDRYVQVWNPSMTLEYVPGGKQPSFSNIGVNPLRKIVTTQAVKTTVMEFDWNGEKQRKEASEVLWKTNQVFKFEWVSTGPPHAATNETAHITSVMLTNIIFRAE